jgi:hypothetical protein
MQRRVYPFLELPSFIFLSQNLVAERRRRRDMAPLTPSTGKCARVEGRHDGLAATRDEARQNSRRRRRKDADTGPHTKHGPPGDLLGVLGHAARATARLT